MELDINGMLPGWSDDVFSALLLIQKEVAEYRGSMWMAEDHPVMKRERYLERMERIKALRGPRRKRRQ